MNKINIVYPKKIGKIEPEVYGHFTEHIGGVIYDGMYVGDKEYGDKNGFRKFIVDKIKEINAPVIRWPGGCFAEIYNWRDGIGENRPVRNSWWTCKDGRLEPNKVGTHEFMNLCESVGAKAYLAVNVTSATVLDAIEWMDYCTSKPDTTTLSKLRERNGRKEPFDVAYIGIGNENWGGGGNMRPEYYADLYRKYATLLNQMPFEKKLIAGGPNDDDYNWTHKFFESIEKSEKHIDGYSIHYYCSYLNPDDDPVNFKEDNWYWLLRNASKMEELIDRHWAIIKGHGMDKKCKLVIDEWGAWHREGSGPSKGANLYEQQSTMRDAMVAAITLNIFNNNADKIMMTNVAQLVNNLHSLFLASEDKCVATPNYHIFDMFKNHQNATALEVVTQCGEVVYKDKDNNEFPMKSLSVSASEKDGKITVTIGNLSYDDDAEIELCTLGANQSQELKVTTLTHKDLCAHNTFENPDNVVPIKTAITGNVVKVPKGSVVAIEYEII